MSRILTLLEENRRLLTVILDYLAYVANGGGDPDTRVRRRTVRLRHILANMIIDGVKAGDLRPVNVKRGVEMLYSFIESAVFRLIVLGRTNVDELRNALVLAVDGFSA